MPPRYSSTPAWARKRKRNQETSPPRGPSAARPEPSSAAPSSVSASVANAHSTTTPSLAGTYSASDSRSRHREIDEIARQLIKWQNTQEPILRAEYIEACRIRVVELCHELLPGHHIMNKIVDKYRSLGADEEHIHELYYEQLEPEWTDKAISNVVETLKTPHAVADAMRTLLSEVERKHGQILDKSAYNNLLQSINLIASPMEANVQGHDAQASTISASDMEMPHVQQPTLTNVAPVANMLGAPPLDVKPASDLRPGPSRPPISFGLSTSSATDRPSESPHKRPRLGLDTNVANKRNPEDAFMTPASESSSRRVSSISERPFNPPTGPRRQLYEGKIYPSQRFFKEYRSEGRQAEILGACRKGHVPIRDVVSLDNRAWIVQFDKLEEFEHSIGTSIEICERRCEIQPHIPNQPFQIFGSKTALRVEGFEIGDALARAFSEKFSLQHQIRPHALCNWVVCFQATMERDSFDVDVYVRGGNEAIRVRFFGIPSTFGFCFNCGANGHLPVHCQYVRNFNHRESRYCLSHVPRLMRQNEALLDANTGKSL